MSSTALSSNRHDAATRRAILNHLKMEGPSKAADMGRRFDLTPMAVRLHLYDLEKQGVVRATSQTAGRGRPSKIWHLTEKADDAFPDSHRDLAVELLGAAREAFGQEGINELVEQRGKAQIKRYRKRIGKTSTAEEKLRGLAHARTEEGYMADVQKAPEGGWLFIENHCPICTVARDCTGLCANELEVFRKVLGSGFTVSRAEHIISGDRRCAYQVTPRKSAQKPA